jgi:hypothetical protein
MSSQLMPGDREFHEDKQLVADLTTLNGQISRYVLRQLDADAGRVSPASTEDERALSETLAVLAGKVQQRADRRAASGAQSTLEGEATLRRLTAGRPSER